MGIKESLIKFSYSLSSSKKYKSFKRDIWEVLEDLDSSKKRSFDFFMIILVLVTIFIMIYEIKHYVPPYIYAIEIIAIVIFIIEWLGRFWVSSDFHQMIIEKYEQTQLRGKKINTWILLKDAFIKKLKFIFSPMSIIDLLAILPFYRPLRIFRFFLLFRLFKIFRYTQNMNFLFKVFVEKKFEFITLVILFSFLVFFASTIIYVFEGSGENDNINSFYDAIYWAVVTITTVGYGDISPSTSEGRFATMLLIVSGLGILAFTTSIVTTAMTEKLEQIKENNILTQASKLKDFVLICGYGKMGMVFAEEFKEAKENFVIIDIDNEAIFKANEKSYLALRQDASDPEALEELNIKNNAKYVLAMTNDDALNLSIILSVKSIAPKLEIIARANNVESKKKFKIAGATRVLFPYEMASIATIEYLSQPSAYSAINIILQEKLKPIADEVEIFLDEKTPTQVIKKELIDSFGLKLLGVAKKGRAKEFVFNSKKSEIVVENLDVLILIGRSDDIASFKNALVKG